MRIGVVGAGGRIGTMLVEAIVSAPGLELAACIVAPGSRWLGLPVCGGGIEYRAADAAINARCDVMIDFSTPAATIALQQSCGTKPIPFVIGTTGFSERQKVVLKACARHRPLLMSDNFAPAFRDFLEAADRLRARLPGALETLSEERHRRSAAPAAGGRGLPAAQRSPPADVTEIRFDAGGEEITLVHRVSSPAAYVQGALAAAHWLVASAPGEGLYSFADISTAQHRFEGKHA